MPAPKRSLLPDTAKKRINPYGDTIDRAMAHLAAVEAKIDKALLVSLQVKARETNRRRKIIPVGYVANSDSVGWHWQVPQGENYSLKRITLVADAAGTYVLMIGKPNAQGVREIMGANTAVTFNDGTTGNAYSDAFSNDIYVRAGQDVYIQFAGAAGAATSHTIVATLEVEEFIPVKRAISEAENLSLQVAPPMSEEDAVDSEPPSIIDAQPVPGEHFQSPEDAEELREGSLDVHATAPESTPLIPDAAAHLPPHLRG